MAGELGAGFSAPPFPPTINRLTCAKIRAISSSSATASNWTPSSNDDATDSRWAPAPRSGVWWSWAVVLCREAPFRCGVRLAPPALYAATILPLDVVCLVPVAFPAPTPLGLLSGVDVAVVIAPFCFLAK